MDEHNTLAELSALLIKTTKVLCMTFTLEQPCSSLLFQYPSMMKALAWANASTASCFMSAFGGESPKPLTIKGNPPWLNEFSLVAKALNKKTASPSTRLTTRKTHSDGRKSFTGLSKALTASSGYTKQCGNAMALCALGNSSNEVLRKLKSI